MFLKKYNKETDSWEIILSNAKDVTVTNVLESGVPITDDDIVVNNYNYSDGSGATLNDTLTVISDDISKLQRNVSWLSEHGGGGGGGGGGTGSGYAFVLMSPSIPTGSYYCEDSSITITFTVTGGTSADVFTYRYTYDGTYKSEYKSISNNEIVTIKIDDINMVSSASTHSFLLEGTNPLGLNMVPISFRIFETSLKLALHTGDNLNEFENGELILSKDSPYGNLYLDIKNGVLDAQTTITAKRGDKESSIYYRNSTTSQQTVFIDLFKDLFDRATIKTNDVFAIEIYATSILSGVVDLKTSTITLSVRFSSSNDMLIYFDGLTYYDDVEAGRVTASKFENNGRLRFSFKVKLKEGVSNNIIYYTAGFRNQNTEEWTIFAGQSFDDYSVNIQDVANQNIVLQTSLAGLQVSDKWLVQVKAWTYDGGDSTITIGEFDIISANTDFFPRQHNKRNLQDVSTGNTCLFAWCNSSQMLPTQWQTRIDNYCPIQSTLEETCIAYITLYNINNAGNGRVDAPIPYYRIQNDAYALADLSNYQSELSKLTKYYTKQEGFTFSITFEADIDANKEKVAFFYGKNDIDGNLINGFKIKGEKVVWQINGNNGKSHTLSAFIRQGAKNTVDFSYRDGTAYIYVNGIPSAAYEIGDLNSDSNYEFGSTMYFGVENVDETLINYCDMSLYEVAVYTYALNPLQIAINGKNARLDGSITEEERKADYNEWKNINLIYTEEDAPEKPISYLINENGEFSFDVNSLNKMQEYSPIPIININANGSGFSKEVFHKDYSNDKDITAQTFNCEIEYYDPEVRKFVSFRGKISIQGTSTIGYWVKNLEVFVDEPSSDDESGTKVKLFQPKKNWFPEKEFTLKADMVDSSHANNATIGKWINESGVMPEPNPAMKKFTNDTRPKDRIKTGGSTFTHIDERDGVTTIDYDENVSIKYNLEGFPVILLMRFDGELTTELVGLYSFNLGRYSYYNMGLRFLKAFSRREKSSPSTNVICPALVDHYEEYGLEESFGGGSDAIPINGIFSYEFSDKADDNDDAHMTWSQADISILKYYGGFNFNGSSADPREKVGEQAPIWTKLSTLFYQTAQMELPGNPLYQGKNRYYYSTTDGWQLAGGNPYGDGDNPMYTFDQYINIGNAVAYFMIAIAFGMVDSLGKNLTIRTWDGGNKWWTNFYDMDSALGLYNEGDEGVPETSFIDLFRNLEESPYTVVSTPHADTTYNAYKSKLWEIFRDKRFCYIQNNEKQYYEQKWTAIRTTASQLANSDTFIEVMEKQVGKCGELMYGYDYNSKYLSNKQNISMLHGLRIEYVRNWLRNRVYYLDGVFEDLNAISSQFDDSPFYRDAVNISNEGHITQSIGFIEYTMRPTTTMMMRINTGSGTIEYSGKYLIEANKDNRIRTAEHTSGKQTNFTTSSLITKFEGLDGINVTNFSTNVSPYSRQLCSLTGLTISGTKSLRENPLDPYKIFMYDGKSSLEKIDLSYTSFKSDVSSKNFTLDFTGFSKLKEINISYSPVTSIVLPDSSLKRFLIAGSNITSLYVVKQPILSSLIFEGCQNLNTIVLRQCDAIQSLEIGGQNGLRTLTEMTIQDCNALTSITITNNVSLRKIELLNNSNLENIEISGCINENLSIEIIGSPLKSIKISDVASSNVIILPEKELLSGVSIFTLLNFFDFRGIQYGKNNAIEKYRGENVLDLSPFKLLDSRVKNTVIIRNISNLKYVRVNNNIEKPFYLIENTFYRCEDVTRIFGNINIINGSNIGYMPNFYLNEIDDNIVPGEVPEFNDGTYYTNVSFTATDLSGMFGGTSCNISDVYYVLGKCDNVRNINGLFSGCINVRTGYANSSHLLEQADFSKNAFNRCKKVENIDNIFSNTNIRGYLDPEMLIPLLPISGGTTTPNGIVSFNNVFENCDVYLKPTDSFFIEGNYIKTIKGFNPICCELSGGIPIEKKFNSSTLLANLSYLEEITNSFCGCAIDFRETGDTMLESCTSLKTIVGSFRKVAPGTNTNNIPTKYFYDLFGATALENISNSFSFCTDGEYSNEDCVKLCLGNSFFSKINGSIKYIIGRMTKVYNENKSSTGGIFFTENRDTTLVENAVIKEINYNDCDNENFPYKILSGCTKLVECPGLFYDVNGDANRVAALPGNTLFKDCINLENFSYGFANMKIKYNLTSEGFKKCKLVNLSNVFLDTENYGKIGMLPYRLFYQENGNSIIDLSNALAGANDLNTLPYTCSNEILQNYICELDNNSEFMYKWNIFIYDGTNDFENRVRNFISENGWHSVEEGGVEYFVDSNGQKMAPSLPEQFCDGYSEQISQGNITNENTGYGAESLGIAARPNYFCPPDILNYCLNVNTLNINGIFSQAGQYATSTSSGNQMLGLRGKIPPYLFKNVTQIGVLENVFTGSRNFFPYRWGWKTGEESEPTVIGVLYPPMLFEGLENLYSVNGMFADTVLWGSARVPAQLFNNVKNTLVSVANLWNHCKWLGGVLVSGGIEESQLSDQLFINCASLSDISGMFNNSNVNIMQTLFNPSFNRLIVDCSSFMNKCSQAKGTIPLFWNGWSMTRTNSCYYGIESAIESGQITNVQVEDIPRRYKGSE